MPSQVKKKLEALVAKNIKAERLRKGITQESLALLTGFSVRFISRLETQPQNLRLDKLEIFASALGIPAMSLLSEVNCEPFTESVTDDFSQALGLLQGIFTRCFASSKQI